MKVKKLLEILADISLDAEIVIGADQNRLYEYDDINEVVYLQTFLEKETENKVFLIS